ncbi:MAG: hypothetical protein RLZZ175_3146 [Bacteroidota bacterium]|jgi:hypothetical protein
MVNKAVNSGIDALTGFAFQRNTALFLLLEHYEEKFKNKKYFICLEHLDDFLFCFLDENNNAKLIEAFQSKKKSTGNWTINEEMHEIIFKILNSGLAILNDSIPKTKDFKNLLFFTTNQTISLDYEIVVNTKKKKQSVKVKQDNELIQFLNLPDELKSIFKSKINDEIIQNELDKLHFYWIDLNRTVQKQENQLVGQLESIFKKEIIDPRAAVNSLISLFNHIEVIYNQGNIAKLLDKSKRVSSDQIESAFNILTTKSKAFDEWRAEKDNIANAIKIRHFDRDSFEVKFTSAFDLFKDLSQSEHQKIFFFVKENYEKSTQINLGDIINELYDNFLKNYNSPFSGIDLKAIIYAAYFESTFKRNS